MATDENCERSLSASALKTSEQIISNLDADISKHSNPDTVIALKYQRNALLTIVCFPAELLAKIFGFVMRSLMDRPVSEILFWDMPDVIQVAGICRHWREVALDCPSLWGRITCTWPSEMIEAHLRRSKATPLAAQVGLIRGPDDSFEGSVELILREMPRIYSLVIINVLSPQEWPSFQPVSLLLLPAPKLVHLLWMNKRASPFPLSLKNCPALKTLSLHKVTIGFPMDYYMFHNLSHFTLVGIPSEDQPTIPELLKVLEACYSLEYLELSKVGPRGPLITSHLSPIKLPNLLQIQVHIMPAPTCANLLDHLIIPPSCAIHLEVGDFPFDEPISVLPAQFCSSMKNISLQIASTDLDVLVAFNTTTNLKQEVMATVRLTTAYNEMWIHCEQRIFACFALLGTIVKRTSMTDLVSVFMQIPDMDNLDTETWRGVLSLMPRLQILATLNPAALDGGHEITLADCLTVPNVPGDHLCPKLTNLILHDACLSLQLLKKLEECLDYRRNHGMRMTAMAISGCYDDDTGPEDLVGLRDMLDKLILNIRGPGGSS